MTGINQMIYRYMDLNQVVVKFIFNSKFLGYLIELNKTLENSLSNYKFLVYNVNNILNDYINIYYYYHCKLKNLEYQEEIFKKFIENSIIRRVNAKVEEDIILHDDEKLF